jgi:predicted transcriptional regulator
MRAMNVRLDDETSAALTRLAARYDVSQARLINEAIKRLAADHDDHGPLTLRARHDPAD